MVPLMTTVNTDSQGPTVRHDWLVKGQESMPEFHVPFPNYRAEQKPNAKQSDLGIMPGFHDPSGYCGKQTGQGTSS